MSAVAAVVLCWVLFASGESRRFAAVHTILAAPSAIHVVLSIDRDRGPIVREEWRIADVDGRSAAHYTIVARSGRAVSVDAVMVSHDVPFLFDQVVGDGIWELPSRPPRGDTTAQYTIRVEQAIAGQSGRHTFGFTDPQYWATTAGRQYHIILSRNGPLPDLLKLRSTALAEPRYAAIVTDIEGFGSARFKAAVARARAELFTRTSAHST